MPVSNGFARHPWPTRPRTGSTADFGPPGSRLDGPAMLVQEMLKKDASKQQHPTSRGAGQADWTHRLALRPLHAGRRGRAIAAGTGQTQSSVIEARH
jgi:hypothetical protein